MDSLDSDGKRATREMGLCEGTPRELTPAFESHWDQALMLHYSIEPKRLQPFVPFALDVRDGLAWVSAVAFTMRGLRPQWGGRLAEELFRPIATHEFLNVRAYVTHRGEPGIYFLAEWLPNPLSVLLGRPLFGLPYRRGRLEYHHDYPEGTLCGRVEDYRGLGALRYCARVDLGKGYAPAAAGSLTEFLMERYTAFTEWRGWQRRFQVWHEPWLQAPAEVEVLDESLLDCASAGPWARYARRMGANYSPGVSPVGMSAPSWLGKRAGNGLSRRDE